MYTYHTVSLVTSLRMFRVASVGWALRPGPPDGVLRNAGHERDSDAVAGRSAPGTFPLLSLAGGAQAPGTSHVGDLFVRRKHRICEICGAPGAEYDFSTCASTSSPPLPHSPPPLSLLSSTIPII